MLKKSIYIFLMFFLIQLSAYASDYTELDLSGTCTYLNLKDHAEDSMIIKGITADGASDKIDSSDGPEFRSSNEIVLTVTNDGTLIAHNTGVSVVTVSYGALQKSIIITVTQTNAGRVFYDSFETNQNKTDECALYGQYSYDCTKPDNYCMNPVGHTAMMWFYDDMEVSAGTLAITNTPVTYYYDVGVDAAFSGNYYILKDGLKNETQQTSVVRSKGWHQIYLDISLGKKHTLYLDGIEIKTAEAEPNRFYWMRTRKISGNGKMYADEFSTFSMDGNPAAYNLNLIGEISEGAEIEAGYSFYHARGWEESDSLIEWYTSVDNTSFEKVGTGKTYVLKPGEEDKYIKFIVTPKTKDLTGQKTESKVYKKKTPPVALNAVIHGEVEDGRILEASYEFSDINGDTEGESIYQWYISDKPDGEFIAIDGANEKSYTVKSKDEGKYIRFSVIPVSVDEPYNGEMIYSPAVGKAEAPYADNVVISGDHFIGAELSGKYDYHDNNLDAEGVSIYEWWREEADGTLKLIGNSSVYTLTDDDAEKNIYFSITPVSVNKPYKGDSKRSEAFWGPVRPTAKDVEINGTAKVGNILTGKYKYYHAYGIEEGKSKYRWVTSGGVCVGTDVALELTSELAGKIIYFEVTPVAMEKPFSGDAYRSRSVTIAKVAGSVHVSSGGGGGGTSRSSGFSAVVKQPTVTTSKVEQNVTVIPDKAADPSSFKDIDNHWAKEYIVWAVENGYSNGTSDSEFSPDATITSAELATLLSRVAKLKPVEYRGIFSDVKNSDWYSGYVQVMADNKIISDSGEFKNGNINREDMVVMLMNTWKYITGKKVEVEEKQNIADREMLNAWNEVYVDKAIEIGLIKGTGGNNFKPHSYLTRAEAMTVIKRLVEISEEDK